MKPAEHPPSCPTCTGTGWQDGPVIHSQANGDPVTYSTVEPCTHHWTNDNPKPDGDTRR